jgi:hypothetical protein
VLALGGVEVPAELGADDGRQRRGPVLVALARSYGDLLPGEVDVLHPEAGALEKAQARAIEQDGHEPGDAVELADDRAHLVAREHDG